MKKALHLSLAIILCFAMLLPTTSLAFAEAISDPAWTFYDNTTTILGTGGKLKSASATQDAEIVYTGEDGDGDGYSYKLDGTIYAQYATIKLTVEPDKYYEASFNFYATEIGANNSAFSNVFVAKDGAVKGDYSTDYCGHLARGYGYYTNKNKALIKAEKTTANYTANTWNSMVVPFYSGNNTEVLLAMRPATSTTAVTYIDNLKLNETNKFDGANDVLSNLNTAVYWSNSNSSFTDSYKHNAADTYIAKDYTTYTAETDADGDGVVYTMNAKCYAQYVTAQFSVEKNQNYELKFKYNSTVLDGFNGMFSDVRIAEVNGANSYAATSNLVAIDRNNSYLRNKNGAAIGTNVKLTSGVAANTWNEMTINFYSGNRTTVMLVLRPTVGNTIPVSIDAVSLTAVDSFVGSERVASDFTIYDNTTTNLGAGGTVRNPNYGSSYSYDNEVVYTEENLDNEAYRFDGCSAQWPSAKIAVKAKTYYNLTFRYFGTVLDGYQWGDDGMFSDVIVLPDGKAKNVVSDHLAYLGRNDAYYNNKNGTKIENTNRINSGVKANEWNTVTLSFYSGNLTEVLLAMRPTVATVYVDAIKLTTVSTLPSANLFPNGWTVYQMGQTGTNDGVNEHTTAVVSNSTDIVHSTDIDNNSIVLESSTYAQYPTLPIVTEKNKYYTLKFYYYCDSINTAYNNNYVLSHIYLAPNNGQSLATSAIVTATTAADGTVIKNGEKITVPGFTTREAVAKAWNEVKITFFSGDNTTLRFALRPAASNTATVYVDDITLNDVSVVTANESKAAIRVATNTDSANVTKNGIRCYNTIQTDWISESEANIVEYGSIAISKSKMNAEYEGATAPNMSMLSTSAKAGVAYRAEGKETITGNTAVSLHWNEANTDDIFTKKVFTTYLTGISKENYGEEYLVRAYAIDANGKVYYGETFSMSIFKVAQAISAANNTDNGYDNAAFKELVVDSGLGTAYEEWCTANSLEPGELYASLAAAE